MTQESWVQSQVIIPKTKKKWYLMLPCLPLSIIRNGSRVKWSNPGKGVEPSLIPRCSSYRKGSFRVALDYSRQLYFILKIFCWLMRPGQDRPDFPQQLQNIVAVSIAEGKKQWSSIQAVSPALWSCIWRSIESKLVTSAILRTSQWCHSINVDRQLCTGSVDGIVWSGGYDVDRYLKMVKTTAF